MRFHTRRVDGGRGGVLGMRSVWFSYLVWERVGLVRWLWYSGFKGITWWTSQVDVVSCRLNIQLCFLVDLFGKKVRSRRELQAIATGSGSSLQAKAYGAHLLVTRHFLFKKGHSRGCWLGACACLLYTTSDPGTTTSQLMEFRNIFLVERLQNTNWMWSFHLHRFL